MLFEVLHMKSGRTTCSNSNISVNRNKSYPVDIGVTVKNGDGNFIYTFNKINLAKAYGLPIPIRRIARTCKTSVATGNRLTVNSNGKLGCYVISCGIGCSSEKKINSHIRCSFNIENELGTCSETVNTGCTVSCFTSDFALSPTKNRDEIGSCSDGIISIIPAFTLKGNSNVISGDCSINCMTCALAFASSLCAFSVGTLTASCTDALTLMCRNDLNYLKNITVKVTGVYTNLEGVNLACLKINSSYLNVRNVPPLIFSSTGSNLTVGKSKSLAVYANAGNEGKNASTLILCECYLKSNGNVFFGGNDECLITTCNSAKTLSTVKCLYSRLFKSGLRNESAHIKRFCLCFVAIGCIGNSDVRGYNRVTLALLSASVLCAFSVKALATLGTYALTLVCRNDLNYLKNITVKVAGVYTNLEGVNLACLKINSSYLNVRNVPPLIFSSTGSNLTVGKSKSLAVYANAGNEGKNASTLILCECYLKSNGNVFFGGNDECLITTCNSAKTLSTVKCLYSRLFKSGLRNESAHIKRFCLCFVAIGCIGNSDVGSYYNLVTLALLSTSILCALSVKALATLGTYALTLMCGRCNRLVSNNVKNITIKVTGINTDLEGVDLAGLKLYNRDMNLSNVPIECGNRFLRRTNACGNLTVDKVKGLIIN